MPRQVNTLTLADAREIIAAGEKNPQELGVPYNLAVIDACGALISHARMDGGGGAAGASGGTVEQDEQVVEAAVGAFRGRR